MSDQDTNETVEVILRLPVDDKRVEGIMREELKEVLLDYRKEAVKEALGKVRGEIKETLNEVACGEDKGGLWIAVKKHEVIDIIDTAVGETKEG